MKNIKLMREYIRLVEAGEKEPWKHFELYLPIAEKWVTMCSCSWFTDCAFEFRSKPKTININGFEVPEPANKALNVGDRYYIASPVHSINYTRYVWLDDRSDRMFLRRGIIHLTKEAATQHARALLSFTAKSED